MCRAGGPYCYDRRMMKTRDRQKKLRKIVETRALRAHERGDLDTESRANALMSELRSASVVHVALDLDNTTVDFTGGLRDYLAAREGLSPSEARRKYPDPTNYNLASGSRRWFGDIKEFLGVLHDAEGSGLYRNLRARAGAVSVIKKILRDRRVKLHVVTARSPEYDADTHASLEHYGIDMEIEHAENKDAYPAHIFIDDKADFAERVQEGTLRHPDGSVKKVIVPANGYNLHLNPARTWGEIYDELNAQVEQMFSEEGNDDE